MKVILAGCPKTGTKTMCAAFEVLGIRTYDLMDNYWNLYREWDKILTTGGGVEDFRRMYDGVDAVTDIPCNWFWEELHQAFPEAKIILTLRDEDAWYESFRNQMENVNNNFFAWLTHVFAPSSYPRKSYRKNMFANITRSMTGFHVPLHNKMILTRIYRQHNLYVQQKAPKDKLLVFKLSDGWEPLCKFLGVEIPSTPFPHKNKKAELLKEMEKNNACYRRMILEAFAVMGLSTTAAIFLGYKFYRIGGLSRVAEILSRNWTWMKNIGS